MPGQEPRIECRFSGIALISESPKPTAERIRALIPDGPVVVCDCHVDGSEEWNGHEWGYEQGGIANIDHHAPDPRWERPVSSGNLAVLYLRECGPCPAVVVNHSDCDSVLSAGIVAGILEPKSEYEAAVIAADHTGEENHIADLLQALQDKRDLSLSFDQVLRQHAGGPANTNPETNPLLSFASFIGGTLIPI